MTDYNDQSNADKHIGPNSEREDQNDMNAYDHGDIADESVETPRSGKGKYIILAVIIVIGLLVAGFFISKNLNNKAGGVENENNGPVVTIMTANSGHVEKMINATGTIAARRDIPVGVVGEGGSITRILVDAGDWVKQGQVLAIIDKSVQSQQLQSLAAQIEVSRADAALAQQELNRALQLVERGFISKADIDRKTATLNAANARVKVAQAQLNEMRARVGRLNIVAPKSGLILERNVELGQVVSGGSGALFRIAEGGEMELQARVDEGDLSQLSVGIMAKVTPVGTEKAFDGQIWQLSPTIDPQNRQGIARIALGYDAALRPGGFANAQIISGSSQSIILPESTVQSDDDSSYVYIVDKENKIERRNIILGPITASGIVVESGLNGSEKIVLYAAGFLNPGETVKQRKENDAMPGEGKKAAAKPAAKKGAEKDGADKPAPAQ